MRTKLDSDELRLLGVLMEKALTQANSYPITANSLLLGANQRQNREPVMELSESDVLDALRTLQDKGLVKQASPALGARAVRFEHRVVDVFQWDRREQAVMAEMILRGRQTGGELRSRAGRMTAIPDMAAVINILDDLRHADPPFIEELPREPGRSANRFRHLLAEESGEPSAGCQPETGAGHQTMEQRLSYLEARVTELESRIGDIEKTAP